MKMKKIRQIIAKNIEMYMDDYGYIEHLDDAFEAIIDWVIRDIEDELYSESYWDLVDDKYEGVDVASEELRAQLENYIPEQQLYVRF